MNVEQQLENGRFYNEWHRLRVNVLYSSCWLTDKITGFLKPFGITQQQFNILRILRGQYPKALTTLQLRERMIFRMSDTSRLVSRLTSKGLVEKNDCCHDKRLVDVVITEKGLELLSTIDREIHSLDVAVKGVDDQEALQLNELLIKMRNPD